MHRSSTILAVCGSSSLTHAPLWPCWANSNTDGVMGNAFCPLVIPVSDQLRADYTLIGNINVHALDVNSAAIATAVLTFAYDTSTVNDVPGHPGRGQVKPGTAERTLAAIRDQRTR